MSNVFEDAMQALTDREGEVELTLDGLQVDLPFVREPVRLSGKVKVRLNLKETPASGPRSRHRR